MVILYNQASSALSTKIEKPYNAKRTKNRISSNLNVRQLTRENKLFLQSLGLKVLV